MKSFNFYTIIIVTSSLTTPLFANFTVKKTGDTVVEPQALTIEGNFGKSINGQAFQQSAVLTHGNYQYIGFYDGNRRVCIGRRKLPLGECEIARFTDYDFKSNDSHNTISIGICPQDGTVHIAFDHHVHPLHYKVSKPGVATKPDEHQWSPALFGHISSELEPKKPITITYPRFIQTPEGALQFFYRKGGSGNGDSMMVDYDPKTATWKNTRQIDSGKGIFTNGKEVSRDRNAYPNGYDYDHLGKLHTTWVWREDAKGGNHDIQYAYSEDRGITWKNSAGHPLSTPAAIDTPGITVVKIDTLHGPINSQSQAVDSMGHIHTVMSHSTEASLKAAPPSTTKSAFGPAAARRHHHYWRDDIGFWQHIELPGSTGTRPKLFFDAKDNAYLIFGGNLADKPVEGESDSPSSGQGLIIMAATANAKWSDWQVIHKERGPFLSEMLGDNVRWKRDGVLSIMVQGNPKQPRDSTALRVLDFTFTQGPTPSPSKK
mgnify:CR=1 FL=1